MEGATIWPPSGRTAIANGNGASSVVMPAGVIIRPFGSCTVAPGNDATVCAKLAAAPTQIDKALRTAPINPFFIILRSHNSTCRPYRISIAAR
jgi:hypothetical protein